MAHVDALSRAPVGEAEEMETVNGLQILQTNLSNEDSLVLAQKNDSKLRAIVESLTKTGQLTTDDQKLREDYELKHGRLFRKITNENEEKLLWVVPDNARWRIVKNSHDDIGHFGLDKTIARLQESFWFPRLRRYVRRYLAACLECLFHKSPAGKKPGMLHSIDKVGVPFHTLHLDHLGPFVRSTTGNTFLIVAVDAFTKFIMVRAVRNAGMNPTRKFLSDIIGIFGAPVRIVTDKGTSYTGKSFVNLCKESNIKHVTNATATPRGNGQVERLNRMLTPAIASMGTRVDEKDWDMRLSQVTWGVNNTIQKATKRTPFSLLFNFTSRSPVGNIVEHAVKETFDEDVMQRRTEAIANIRADQERQRRRYNAKRSKAPTFEPGDMVVVERAPAATGQPLKTAMKYKGPYVVTDKLKFDRYLVEDLPETQQTQNFYRGTAPADKRKRFVIGRDGDSDEQDEDYSPELETQFIAAPVRDTCNVNPSVLPRENFNAPFPKSDNMPVRKGDTMRPDVTEPAAVVPASEPVSEPAAINEVRQDRRPIRQRRRPTYLQDYELY